jgi:hypothetical protein
MGVPRVDIQTGDIIEVSKPHPCGGKQFAVLRIGMDFKIKCEGCGHEIMIPRIKIERRIRKVFRSGQDITDTVKKL